MAGKDNWRRVLDAIYSKWRPFLPILLLSLSTPSAFAITPPLLPLVSWHVVTYLPFSPLPFHLTSKCEIWINVCVCEGMASCELQILADAAIYVK